MAARITGGTRWTNHARNPAQAATVTGGADYLEGSRSGESAGEAAARPDRGPARHRAAAVTGSGLGPSPRGRCHGQRPTLRRETPALSRSQSLL